MIERIETSAARIVNTMRPIAHGDTAADLPTQLRASHAVMAAQEILAALQEIAVAAREGD